MNYPYFPSEKDFMHSMVNKEQHELEDDEIKFVSNFPIDLPKLHFGGLLLPDLVEFYRWLHTQLGEHCNQNTASS